MGSRPSRSLIETVRSTFEKVELNSSLAPDDPAIVELKRTVMLNIAELEITASSDPVETAAGTDAPLQPEKEPDTD